MMNKEAFLKELQSRLAVLAESERQDILAEYAQHIDLRMEGGLTEEEAIRDFGDIEQLTAEILEAYHVDPAFGKPVKKRMTLPDPRPALREGGSAAGGWLRRAGHAIAEGGRAVGRFFRRLGRRAAAAAARCGAWAQGLFSRKSRETSETPEREEQITVEMMEKKPAAQVRPAAGKAAAVGRFCKALVRLAWNLALVVCAAPIAALALGAVAGLGLLAILLAQGYPLVGAALCCLGGLAVCVGILGLGTGLIWHRPPCPAAEAQEEEEGDHA